MGDRGELRPARSARRFRSAIVWIDDGSALVVAFDVTSSATQRLWGSPARRALWRLASGDGPDVALFDTVAAAIADRFEQIVVTGPGAAAEAFVEFVAARHPELAAAIVAVEHVPTDQPGALLAYGRARLLRGDPADRPGVAPRH